MPNFTIYVTGGGDYFYTTLNGVAMIFNDGDLVRSVIFMGSMFALLTGAWYYIQKNVGSGLMKSHTWLEHAIVMVILSFLAFVPTRVTVQDIYGQQNVTPIDNVPLIFSLPASIFSGVNHDIFRAIDTAYQSTTGSTMAVSENGFVTPLKLMLSMRGGLQQVAPEAYQSWFNYIGSCLYNTASTTGGMSQSADVASFLTQNGKDGGFVKVFLRQSGSGIAAVQDGVVVTCAEAKTLLDLRMDALFASGTGTNPSSDVDRLINLNMGEANRNAVNGRWSWSDAMTAANGFQLEVGASAQSAQQYMKNSLMRSVVVDAFGCAANYLSAADQMLCTQSMHDSMEQYKVDAAGRGSWFSNMMLPAMTILQLLFFAFSVVAFLYGIIRGAGAVSFIGKYFLFGAWVFSWLPFVAIINAFINWMVVDKMRMSSLQALTIENYDSYFSGLQSSLALASDLLAATPLITLGFMTGSMFALSSFAQRLSNNDYMKEQNVAPNTVDVAPVMKHDSEFQSNTQTGQRTAATTYEQVSAGDALGSAVESRRTEAVASQLQTADQFSQMVKAQDSKSGSTRITNSDGTTSNVTMGDMFQAGLSKMRSYAQGSQMSERDSGEAEARAKTAFELLGNGVSFSAAWKKAVDGAENKAVQDALSNVLSGMSSYAESTGRQVASAITQDSSITNAHTREVASGFSETASRSESLTQSYAELSSRASSVDSKQTADVSVLGSKLERDRELGTSGKGIDRKINEAYNELKQHRGSEAVDGFTRAKLDDWRSNGGNFSSMTEMAQLQTLRAMGDGVAYANIVADLFTTGPNNISDTGALKGVSGNAGAAQPNLDPTYHNAKVEGVRPGAGNGHAELKSTAQVKDQMERGNDLDQGIKRRVDIGMDESMKGTADGVLNHHRMTPREAVAAQTEFQKAGENIYQPPKDKEEYYARLAQAYRDAELSKGEVIQPIPPASVQQEWLERDLAEARSPANVRGNTPQEREANLAQAESEVYAQHNAKIDEITRRSNEAAERSAFNARSAAAASQDGVAHSQPVQRTKSDAHADRNPTAAGSQLPLTNHDVSASVSRSAEASSVNAGVPLPPPVVPFGSGAGSPSNGPNSSTPPRRSSFAEAPLPVTTLPSRSAEASGSASVPPAPAGFGGSRSDEHSNDPNRSDVNNAVGAGELDHRSTSGDSTSGEEHNGQRSENLRK